MFATTTLPTTHNNDDINNSYNRNFVKMLKFVYALVMIIKEVIA